MLLIFVEISLVQLYSKERHSTGIFIYSLTYLIAIKIVLSPSHNCPFISDTVLPISPPPYFYTTPSLKGTHVTFFFSNIIPKLNLLSWIMVIKVFSIFFNLFSTHFILLQTSKYKTLIELLIFYIKIQFPYI